MAPPLRPRLFAAAALVGGLLLSFTVSEAVLRSLGRRPWTDSHRRFEEPVVYEPDSVLGWRNRPGSYRIAPYHPGGAPIHMTILAGGDRRTAQARVRAPIRRCLLVGGSFTQGWAVSDRETFAWKLQQRLPRLAVQNYGTGGYGTLQSLLLLERILPSPVSKPTVVIYGFIQHHEDRNVAPAYWLRILSQSSHRGHVRLPFATWDPGKGLIRHAPRPWPALPLRTHSATVAALEDAYMKMITNRRTVYKQRVTMELIRAMKTLCQARHADFYVAFLNAHPQVEKAYSAFFNGEDIDFIACSIPLVPTMCVPGNPHPNGRTHTLWAEAMARPLKNRWPFLASPFAPQ